MNMAHPLQAKIVSHAAGLGAPSAEDVRLRAHEIAQIDGRHGFNDGDWQQAKNELHGGHESDHDGEEDELRIGSGSFRSIPTDTGHRVAQTPLENEVSLGEELIAEGMDEAMHDRMLAASKESLKS